MHWWSPEHLGCKHPGNTESFSPLRSWNSVRYKADRHMHPMNEKGIGQTHRWKTGQYLVEQGQASTGAWVSLWPTPRVRIMTLQLCFSEWPHPALTICKAHYSPPHFWTVGMALPTSLPRCSCPSFSFWQPRPPTQSPACLVKVGWWFPTLSKNMPCRTFSILQNTLPFSVTFCNASEQGLRVEKVMYVLLCYPEPSK